MIEVKVWVCPKCGLSVKDEEWRREKAERTMCKNNHEPEQMIVEVRKYPGYFN